MSYPVPKKICKKTVSNKANHVFTRDCVGNRTSSVSTDDDSGHGSGRPQRRQGNKTPIPTKLSTPQLRQQLEDVKKLIATASVIKPKAMSIKSNKPISAVSTTTEKIEKKVIQNEITKQAKDLLAKSINAIKTDNKAKGTNPVGPISKKKDLVIVNTFSDYDNNARRGNMTEEDQQNAEETFRVAAEKMQTPNLKKIKTNLRYDDTCLSEHTMKVIDTEGCKNDILWLNPLFLDKRKNLITIPSESKIRPSKAPVPISKYIRAQQQLNRKPNRRIGEKYMYDKELQYRRIMHEDSFSLNMHTHQTGYDDDMGDNEVMQRQMTTDEKKLLGSFVDPLEPIEENREYIESMNPVRLIASESTTAGQPVRTSMMLNLEPSEKAQESTSDGLIVYKSGANLVFEDIPTPEPSTPRDLDEISCKTNLDTSIVSDESDFIEKFFTAGGGVGTATTEKDISGSEGIETEIKRIEYTPGIPPLPLLANNDERVHLPFLYSTMDEYVTFRNSVEVNCDDNLGSDDISSNISDKREKYFNEKQHHDNYSTENETETDDGGISRNDMTANTSAQSAETVIQNVRNYSHEIKSYDMMDDVNNLVDNALQSCMEMENKKTNIAHEDGISTDFWDEPDDPSRKEIFYDFDKNEKVGNEIILVLSNELIEDITDSDPGRHITDSELATDNDTLEKSELKTDDDNLRKSELKESKEKDFIDSPSVFFPDMIPLPDFTLKRQNISTNDYDGLLNNTLKKTRNSESTCSFTDNLTKGDKFYKSCNKDHPDILTYQLPDVEAFYLQVEKLCNSTNLYTVPRYTKPTIYNPLTLDLGSMLNESECLFPKSEVKVFQDMYNKYVGGSKENRESSSVKTADMKVNFAVSEPRSSDSINTNCSETSHSIADTSDDADEGDQQTGEEANSNGSKYDFNNFDATSKSVPLPVIKEESECEVEFEEPIITKSWLYNLIFSATHFDKALLESQQPEEIKKTISKEADQQNVFKIEEYDPTDSWDQSSGVLGSQSDNLTLEDTDFDENTCNFEPLISVNKITNIVPEVTTNFLTVPPRFLKNAETEKCDSANEDLNFFNSFFLSQYNLQEICPSCFIEELPNSCDSAEEQIIESYTVESPSEIGLKNDATPTTEEEVPIPEAQENAADKISEDHSVNSHKNIPIQTTSKSVDIESSPGTNENLEVHLTCTSSECFTIEPMSFENCIQQNEKPTDLSILNKISLADKSFTEISLLSQRFLKEGHNRTVSTSISNHQVQEEFSKNVEIQSSISNENYSPEMFSNVRSEKGSNKKGSDKRANYESPKSFSMGLSNDSSYKFKKRKKTFSSRFVQQFYRRLRGLRSSLSRMLRDMKTFLLGTNSTTGAKRKRSARINPGFTKSVGESDSIIFHPAISVIKNPPTTSFPTFSEFHLNVENHKPYNKRNVPKK